MFVFVFVTVSFGEEGNKAKYGKKGAEDRTGKERTGKKMKGETKGGKSRRNDEKKRDRFIHPI